MGSRRNSLPLLFYVLSAGESKLAGGFFSIEFYCDACHNLIMDYSNIEELKRRECLRQKMRACKDKLFEMAYEEEQKKKKSK